MIPHFREFFNLIVGGILTLGSTVSRSEATGEEECTGRKLFLTVTESPLSCLTAAENEMNLSQSFLFAKVFLRLRCGGGRGPHLHFRTVPCSIRLKPMSCKFFREDWSTGPITMQPCPAVYFRWLNMQKAGLLWCS